MKGDFKNEIEMVLSMYRRKGLTYKKIRDYKEKIEKIDVFCKENNIEILANHNCYKFELDGQKYIVANDLYYKKADVIFFFAGKTRIIEIYDDLQKGFKLNKRGFIIK